MITTRWRKPLAIGMRRSAPTLPQLDLLARPEHDPLLGLDVARHCPEAQSHVERIDRNGAPESVTPISDAFSLAVAPWQLRSDKDSPDQPIPTRNGPKQVCARQE